ncbi:MAG: tetratricopeptide repeat protein [bacterium]|nr:tetratricopeptide repeat protein [bacterium]
MLAALVTGWSGLPVAAEVPETFVEAMTWYRVEAEAGNAEAQFLLGYGYETGSTFGHVWGDPNPFPVDLAEARHWYGEAAAQEHDRARVRLARLLLEAKGGPADPDGARTLLEAAAGAGERDAMSLLGFLLLTVEPFDPVGAYLWLSLAARAGDDIASTNLASLESTLDDTTRERGAAALKDWLEAETR